MAGHNVGFDFRFLNLDLVTIVLPVVDPAGVIVSEKQSGHVREPSL